MNPMIAEYQELHSNQSGIIDLPETIKKFRAEHGSAPEHAKLLRAIEKLESGDIAAMKDVIIQIYEGKIVDAEEQIRLAIETVADVVCIPPSPEQEKNLIFLKNYIEFQRYLIVEATSLIAECERRFEGMTREDDDNGNRDALC
ncbi:MAG: hypothetical protein HQM09_12380 [Candidatus Riflebacteria bacterium]|nr:hypothetical protein [Candidatus Riflebacteria bacterium]